MGKSGIYTFLVAWTNTHEYLSCSDQEESAVGWWDCMEVAEMLEQWTVVVQDDGFGAQYVIGMSMS